MTMSRQLLTILLFLTMILLGSSDFATDKSECANQLMGLATCITFVEGSAKAPTPDCCTGFNQVVGKSLKCLCVLVKDKDQPELGIKFNVTLALKLPKLCTVPTNISDCPRLLKLPKDSQDTKMFEGFAKELSSSPPASTSSPVRGISMTKGTQSSGANSQKWYIGYIRELWIIYSIFPLLFLLYV